MCTHIVKLILYIQITHVVASAQLTLLGLWTIHLRIGQEVDVYSGLPATMKIVGHYLTVE